MTTSPDRHRKTRSRRSLRALGAGIAFVAALGPLVGSTGAGAADAASTPAPQATVSTERTAAITQTDQAVRHWTPERMKHSTGSMPGVRGGKATGPVTPTDRGKPEELAPTTAPVAAKVAAPDAVTAASSGATGGLTAAATAATSEGYWQGSNTANPNAQIGHLFYQQWDAVSRTWKDYNCSGTVVNSENKSVVWTAGHCVYQTYSNVWNRYYVFCPGYRNGSCALGKWTPYSQSTTAQWQNSTCTIDGRCTNQEFQYDFGALKMNAINGYKIANWVGSHGISFNGATYQARYLMGYPLNKTNGEYLYYCYGTNTLTTFNALRISPCSAGGGISGGPWLSQINSSWLGVVHSVNSHGPGTYMEGPYQGDVAKNLFATVRY